MHRLVEENVSEYLEQNKDLRRFFERLRNVNKKMFLVTNSPFHFVCVILIRVKIHTLFACYGTTT